MKKQRIFVKNLDELPPGKTDWLRVNKMTEEEIALLAQSDPDVSLSTPKQLRRFRRVHLPK